MCSDTTYRKRGAVTAESKASLFARIVSWLRAGYPEGVPREDYVALLAVLHRKLTDAEVELVVRRLIAQHNRDNPDKVIDVEEILHTIESVAKETPSEDDVARVGTRLEAAGWHMNEPEPDLDSPRGTSRSLALPPLLRTIVGWLRAGYPEGVPEGDYIPLLALLTRRLSDEEVDQVTAELINAGDLPISKTDIQVLITKITNEMPNDSDVTRVRSRLHAGGMPVIDPA